ncbi:MAG: thymidine phosphorylase family protein [Gammaproteobacteria bacterium]|nr:thymidine phosphorylase family protein [Gammaproteobacteria bacterium]MDH5802956.1 thymidine phosphorylase family protein [Gammaproteobacteria bacterium]
MDTLQLRKVGIDTYLENVAYLHRECEVYRAEGFQALSKIIIKLNHISIYAVLNVVDDAGIVSPGELGLSQQAFEQLNADEGTAVSVSQAAPPRSMDAVRRKINGERLNLEDFRAITNDIGKNRYSKMELAAFLVASGQTGLDREEILHLTQAMTESGDRLDWHDSVVVDKHCIGGIPGNRTSMIVAPIVAAHGTLMPKTSSRAITSPAGTADTMEVLANVELTPQQLHQVVAKERTCLAWGGTAGLAPVDDILISVERPLGIDSMGQMVASILSKKLAAGSTHLLIDIPVGTSAKVRHMREALQLRKLFEYTADRLNLQLDVVLSDGNQPVGRGIGPVLEARDVMQVLNNLDSAPNDLRQKSLRLAGRLLEFDPDVRGGNGFALARDILDSGRALKKMQAIIAAQGKQTTNFELGQRTMDVVAGKTGYVVAINNFQMSKIARLAGAPMDKGAGVDLFKKLGDPVEADTVVYRIHAQFPADFHFACALAQQDSGYRIGDQSRIPTPYAEL